MGCKVTPKINSPSRRGPGDLHNGQIQEAVEYETALDMAGYGYFSVRALCACAGAFFTTGVENCVMSYVLPAAKCELALTTYRVGLINMAFMCGGVASAFFWGIVGDVYGRRNMLCATLLLNAVLTLAESTVSDYRLLLAARCFNGFFVGCPSTLVFTYLSDLVGLRRRPLYLTIVGMSFVGAWLVLPAVAWLVIPIKISYHTVWPIHSWRLYLALGSIPAFVAGLLVLLLPESPRLLLDTSRSQQALEILESIFRSNGGQDEEYKVKRLVEHDTFVSKPLKQQPNRTKDLLMTVLKDLRMFVSRTYGFKSFLILFVFFANMAAGFGLNCWIPELIQRSQANAIGCYPSMKLTMPEDTKLFNASNSTWKEIHENIIEERFNGSYVDNHLNDFKRKVEGCSGSEDDMQEQNLLTSRGCGSTPETQDKIAVICTLYYLNSDTNVCKLVLGNEQQQFRKLMADLRN